MSGTLRHGLVPKALCHASASEGLSREHRGISGRLVHGVPPAARAGQALRSKWQPLPSTTFLHKGLVVMKAKPSQAARNPAVSKVPSAALTTDSSCQLVEKFKLDGNAELQVAVSAPDAASTLQIHMQVTSSSGSPILHWGLIHEGENNWFLPSHCPDGTRVYKERALQTPFSKDGASSFLKLEIDDPQVQAMEFLILDEAQNKWFKNNEQNFRVQLSQADNITQNGSLNVKPSVSPPEDLVQVQAYLRWERKGKQQYTPDQEKVEFEEARKELQLELNKGVSLEELRKKLTHGDYQSNASKQPEEKRHYTIERTQCKKRDIMQIISKHVPEAKKDRISHTPKTPTVLESYLQSKEEEDGGNTFYKKTFKLDNKELLVLVTNPSGRKKVYVVTDREGPLTLHWALSKKAREWMSPPSSILPRGSILKDQACETPFVKSTLPNMSYQAVEFDIDQDEFVGMPFVLFSEGNWLKNNGCDFYADFSLGKMRARKEAGDGKGTAKDLLERIAELESDAERSLMHRFNIAADLMEMADDFGELGLVGILVWMRFMATRQLTWNKNYNVKPREISQAQDRLTSLLQNAYKTQPQHREILRMILSTVGRGGEGDAGQRIRDEILVIQRNNDCKGGMMEEWHQKLHNNTSPDDVIICQALMDYIKSDFDINVYWNTLNSNGITKERLLSYDRAIHSEPSFRHDQKEGLLCDLGHYMRTLKAVHSGADLESSIATCMGYKDEGEGFMVGVQVNPIHGLPSGFPETLKFVLEHVEDRNVEALLEGLLKARMELRPLLLGPHDRLKDLLFLDLSLDSTVRTAIERGYEDLNNAQPERLMYLITLVLDNLALSSDNNEDLIYCTKGWDHALEMCQRSHGEWALYAKSFLDRTRLALASKAEHYQHALQPSAEYLGSLLGVDQWAVSIFTEEIIRAGSAASLSALLNRLDPVLRKVAHLGSWQVISPVEVAGYVVAVDELLAVQDVSYERPTILVARSVKGEEEIPEGTVAVLTPDMPDVLSHVSVRARNSKVCFATCFDQNILSDLQQKEGKVFRLRPTSADVVYSEISERELSSGSSQNLKEDASSLSVTLVRKQFKGRYAISADDFNGDVVGAKSRNISYLRGKVPSWVGIPTSIALPFGVFEKVLSHDQNKAVADELQTLKKRLKGGDSSALGEIREKVLQLVAPTMLVKELKEKMQESGIPWPGNEGEDRWQQAWMAIKKVWASKWNERAYFSTRKAKLDHEHLCMAVLVQEVVSADYAFVIHTTNPSSGDSSEIYAEIVKGLGETLVGAYPGRALSFTCKKNDLGSPKVLGYPSKPIGLFIRQSIIFRSDSNGEDLEGYAGAGLYDSVPMDEEEKVVLDYSSDPLILDADFRQTTLSSIARVGNAIEQLYGSPQDIEGVVKDGKIFVVQTRPQM